jgi:lysine-ketoglutarate reductase/saccharopine dehydrogenase-like protein (TIGR00300 family)
MEGQINKAAQGVAQSQWDALMALIKERAEVEIVEAQPDLPDMPFTANAGLVLGKTAVLSHFLHRERQGEEPHFRKWFEEHGFSVKELPRGLPFEGAGDALLDRDGRYLWAGYGFRSELDSHPSLARWLEIEVLSLRLIDRRFYHLDTCFCPLAGGWLLYYPPAFDTFSNRLIELRVPAEKRIAVGEADAVNFACNAVNIGQTVILNQATPELREKLTAAGFELVETPLTEFMKGGGAAKCLTLRLTEQPAGAAQAADMVESRTIRLEGQLLDSGLLDKALDIAVDNGGSFQVLDFTLGKLRQSPSTADIRISGPSRETLDKIVSQLINIGANLPPSEIQDAQLKPVTQDGVAPEDFYSTTIYPTEVRLNGQWVKLQGQRMDAVIVVSGRDNACQAHCRLMRDLRVGDQVVVGVEGLRMKQAGESRGSQGPRAKEEFSFMAGSVSSERRVEVVVEQIAWELRRIRDRGGRVVVVPGPVVIHTGGGEHLAKLIREGYVQALLGGNAVAVHDIEQNLLGTSLGVDMQRGIPVHGGHRHHLRAINTIRRCGGIAQAVEHGVLKGGVFYECVKHNVPFALAGSIRDDGPLPETEMNLIQAQTNYARLIQGADLILMLSTMLHSIGVGNMTPAGVKLICVDISPAVVTKLADRGSLESVGIVTDVGLFLSRLVQQLAKFSS